MGNKNSGNRSHKPRASGAGRKFKIARLRDGDRVRVIENGQQVVKIARIDRETGAVTLESPHPKPA